MDNELLSPLWCWNRSANFELRGPVFHHRHARRNAVDHYTICLHLLHKTLFLPRTPKPHHHELTIVGQLEPIAGRQVIPLHHSRRSLARNLEQEAHARGAHRAIDNMPLPIKRNSPPQSRPIRRSTASVRKVLLVVARRRDVVLRA